MTRRAALRQTAKPRTALRRVATHAARTVAPRAVSPPSASRSAFAADVAAGLGTTGQKLIPPRWFYDEVGSGLFEVISRLPEYGLTRADDRIMKTAAAEIALRAGRPEMVIELGSGSGRKTRGLIEALSGHRAVRYHPVDVSEAALRACRRELGAIPDVEIATHLGEFEQGLAEAAAMRPRGAALLVLFLGSTIGNLERDEAEAFLARVRAAVSRGDTFLVGADLVKPVPVLLAAYDDGAGVTAAFNRNLLARMNRELGADFDLAAFEHLARWNQAERRIEMHLRARAPQRVSIPAARMDISFRAGETIWTESSVKYAPGEIGAMGERTGWREVASWTDAEWPFAETLLAAR